jgi:pyridinium-3,5-biscarboxylic acid mononucleotide synthase
MTPGALRYVAVLYRTGKPRPRGHKPKIVSKSFAKSILEGIERMDPRDLDVLLRDVRDGRLTPSAAAERLKTLPFENLGFARLDHHRALRRGFGEAVFGAGKTPEQIASIVDRIVSQGQNALVTRAGSEVHHLVRERHPQAVYDDRAHCVKVSIREPEPLPGRLAVVCAGTSDIPVAEEAAQTAEFHGATVDRIHDVGVAGLHRLLEQVPLLREATVIVVAAGMEGALPSVVGGLVDTPVIAVPTSIGYGASFQGLAALLAMLNSCSSGVAVVNIDNGFGAGYLASLMLRKFRPRG